MQLKKATAPGAIQPVKEDVLYRRGKLATTGLLILSGKVRVLAGKEGFTSELGPWNVLAADALLLPDGNYIPDFTAYILSDVVRIIQFQKRTKPRSNSDTSDGRRKHHPHHSTHPGTHDKEVEMSSRGAHESKADEGSGEIANGTAPSHVSGGKQPYEVLSTDPDDQHQI
jgi:hypothetical protein